jgi:hypothetical protein
MVAVRPALIHLERARAEFAVRGEKTNWPNEPTGLSQLAAAPTGYEGDAAGATVRVDER